MQTINIFIVLEGYVCYFGLADLDIHYMRALLRPYTEQGSLLGRSNTTHFPEIRLPHAGMQTNFRISGCSAHLFSKNRECFSLSLVY